VSTQQRTKSQMMTHRLLETVPEPRDRIESAASNEWDRTYSVTSDGDAEAAAAAASAAAAADDDGDGDDGGGHGDDDGEDVFEEDAERAPAGAIFHAPPPPPLDDYRDGPATIGPEAVSPGVKAVKSVEFSPQSAGQQVIRRDKEMRASVAALRKSGVCSPPPSPRTHPHTHTHTHPHIHCHNIMRC
jgi:hypothetical protein